MSTHSREPLGRGPDPDVAANQSAMEAVVAIRKLGEQLVEAFDRLDKARETLHEHGLEFGVRFTPEIDAAYMKYRAVPFWDRAPWERVERRDEEPQRIRSVS